MKRRDFLLTATTAALPAVAPAEPEPAPRSPLGIAWTSFMIARRIDDPLLFADYAASLGAAGIQAPLPDTGAATVRQLRDKLERHGLYFEGALSLPFQAGDEARFERQLQAAKDAGALCVRTACLSGRRYETFRTMDDWRAFAARSKDALRRAIPIAEKVALPLAIENHKDWLADELAALMKAYSSPYAGVCLDFGNNLSLLEDPYEVAGTLAPYTLSTHVKDARVSFEKAGTPDAGPAPLLLGDVPLGEGVLDIGRILRLLANGGRNPRLSLEMISRAPLRIPVLGPAYWATFPERPGLRLARTVELGARLPVEPEASVTLGQQERERWEETNVKCCLAWGRGNIEWKGLVS